MQTPGGKRMAEIIVGELRPADRARWDALWRGYLEFYETSLPPEIYAHTWQRLMAADGAIRGLGARLGEAAAPLAGIAHYLFHAHGWMREEVCYLQDLFVDPGLRSRGCGRALIEQVAATARARGCARLYWTTKEDNHAARRLYDRIARFNGFIRYDYPLK
jgi:GNAT superfamily N-acetyltransferase